MLCHKPRASVCVCVGVSVPVFPWVSAQPPAAAPRCIALVPRVRAKRHAACRRLAVAFLREPCASPPPAGSWHLGSAGVSSVCMFPGVACPSLLQSDVCPLPAWTSGSVLCARCHPLFCDHPCSCRKWLDKEAKGVGGGRGRDPRPSPPPHSPNTPRSIFQHVG